MNEGHETDGRRPVWQITTRRLLIATFRLGVALAVCRIRTREPYTILLAGYAIAFALLSLVGGPQSERRRTVVVVVVMLSASALIGIAYAALGW